MFVGEMGIKIINDGFLSRIFTEEEFGKYNEFDNLKDTEKYLLEVLNGKEKFKQKVAYLLLLKAGRLYNDIEFEDLIFSMWEEIKNKKEIRNEIESIFADLKTINETVIKNEYPMWFFSKLINNDIVAAAKQKRVMLGLLAKQNDVQIIDAAVGAIDALNLKSKDDNLAMAKLILVSKSRVKAKFALQFLLSEKLSKDNMNTKMCGKVLYSKLSDESISFAKRLYDNIYLIEEGMNCDAAIAVLNAKNDLNAMETEIIVSENFAPTKQRIQAANVVASTEQKNSKIVDLASEILSDKNLFEQGTNIELGQLVLDLDNYDTALLVFKASKSLEFIEASKNVEMAQLMSSIKSESQLKKILLNERSKVFFTDPKLLEQAVKLDEVSCYALSNMLKHENIEKLSASEEVIKSMLLLSDDAIELSCSHLTSLLDKGEDVTTTDFRKIVNSCHDNPAVITLTSTSAPYHNVLCKNKNN